MKRLAIIVSHPIQYHSPLFQLIAERNKVHLKVFYTWGRSAMDEKFDPGFGKKIEWDIPLLEGYEYSFVKNVSKDPGSHHFKGIINPGLIDEVTTWKPDLLWVFGWSFLSHLKIMRHFHKNNNVKVLFRGDSTLLDKQHPVKKIFRQFFLKWVYSHIDFALYVGTNNKNYFLAYGLKEKQLIFAPHAIDNDRFAEPEDRYQEKAAVWRKELGIKENELVILFAGKLETKKDPLFLLELMKILPGRDIKVVITGNGILEEELKEKALKDKRIIFLDFQNQQKMPVVYRLADVFILPSRGPGETWGLAINEAMASGCVIMASTQVGGAIDLIDEGKNGVVFEIGEIRKCGDFVESLLNDSTLLKKMKDHSKQKIKNFSFIKIVQAIEHNFI